MINKFLMVLVALVCAICIVPGVMGFSGTGSGTIGDPYIITSTNQWAEMSGQDDYYALGLDIDFQSDESKSVIIQDFGGVFDGQGFSLKNFYNSSEPLFSQPSMDGAYAGLAMFVFLGGDSTPIPKIENVIVQNCTINVENDPLYGDINYGTPGHAMSRASAYAILVAGSTIYNTDLTNIYIDEDSWLRLSGTINASKGYIVAGTVYSRGGYQIDMQNVVSRGNINITTPLRQVNETYQYDSVAGIAPTQTCIALGNILYAGDIVYSWASTPGDVYTIVYKGDSNCYDGESLYYDSTLLSTETPTDYSSGVPTSGMTNQSNFANMTFNSGGMAMSNIASIFHGYPIPYYFNSIPPTPTPTPTITPTWTGTPVPTGTPTPTPTPTPTNVASPSTIRWTTVTGSTITSAYFGDEVRFSFDTVVDGINPPYYQTDAFFLRLWGKDAKTGQWVFLSVPGWYGNVNGSTTLIYTPDNQAVDFNGDAWSGWNQITLTTIYSQYMVELVGYEYSGGYPEYVYGISILTAKSDPWQFSNIGTWAYNFGGDGFRYLLAVIIIVILGCIPFFLTRNFNMIIEMLMVMFGIGISFALGLIDLWVVGIILIGIVAVFVLQRGD